MLSRRLVGLAIVPTLLVAAAVAAAQITSGVPNPQPRVGNPPNDVPDYRADPSGATIPLDAHIRLARPRTKASEQSRIMRRGYNYSRGLDEAGQLDMGLVFVSYRRELERFAATQKRLAGEPLIDYVVPTGGGYFYCPPAAADPQDWVGSAILG